MAIIANDGRGIFVIYREGEEINYVLLHLIDSSKTLQRCPLPTPWEAAPRAAVFLSIKTMPPEGKTARHGGDV